MNIKKFANPVFLSLFVLMVLGATSSGITSASGVSIEDQNNNMWYVSLVSVIVGIIIFVGHCILFAKSFTPAALILNGGVDFKKFFLLSIISAVIVGISSYGLSVNHSDNKMSANDKSDINIRIASILTAVSVFLLGLLTGKYTYEQ